MYDIPHSARQTGATPSGDIASLRVSGSESLPASRCVALGGRDRALPRGAARRATRLGIATSSREIPSTSSSSGWP